VWQPDGKQMRSEKIIYNYRNNTVNAGDSSTGDRVQITLPPKSRSPEPGEVGGQPDATESQAPLTPGESLTPPASPGPTPAGEAVKPREAAGQ
jgi:hypothetical protein